MNSLQDLKRLIIPLLKGSPIIMLCFIVAISIGYRSVLYTNPMYESTAKIKLDDISHGISSSTLYEDFDMFTNTNKIAAEVEILKSRLLISKTLEKLDFDVSYFRVGKIRTRELYNESPFLVDYSINDAKVYDELFDLQVLSDSTFHLTGHKIDAVAKFGDSVRSEGFVFIVMKNSELLARRSQLHLLDRFQFVVHSKESAVDRLIGSKLDVTSVDKDVAVIRVSYKCEVPEKSSVFVNTLAETYVEDYVANRTGAAKKTVNFIDNRLDVIAKELQDSEMRLEQYRLQHNIVNTRQETETDLRKIAQLKIQLANLEMNETAIDSLYAYINDDSKSFLELAPNFEAFNDLLSTELIKKLKLFQSEKKDLLIKYTEEDEKVQVVDRNVEDIEKYIRESISNSRKNISIKRKEIENTIAEAEKVFIGLPTKEKDMVILERNFHLNQKIYNFLTEKRTEASIAEAANISFHRIIQNAYTPTHAVSPKKTLTLIVSGFLGLLIGIAIVYLRTYLGGKVHNREDIEKIANTPVSGIIKRYGKTHAHADEDFQALIMNMKIRDRIEKHSAIVITSSITREGKTFVSHNLAKAFASIGWKVALLDLNFRNPELPAELGAEVEIGISEVISNNIDLQNSFTAIDDNLTFIGAGSELAKPMKLIHHPELETHIEKLKNEFDIVIIDSPGTAITPDAIQLMRICDHTYYIIKANHTKSHFLLNADVISEEYELENVSLLLNNVHQATNFNGLYTGSQFRYGFQGLGLIGKLRHYVKSYL